MATVFPGDKVQVGLGPSLAPRWRHKVPSRFHSPHSIAPVTTSRRPRGEPAGRRPVPGQVGW